MLLDLHQSTPPNLPDGPMPLRPGHPDTNADVFALDHRRRQETTRLRAARAQTATVRKTSKATTVAKKAVKAAVEHDGATHFLCPGSHRKGRTFFHKTNHSAAEHQAEDHHVALHEALHHRNEHITWAIRGIFGRVLHFRRFNIDFDPKTILQSQA